MDLNFFCAKCHNLVDTKTASAGCGICACKMFRVARGGMPMIVNPIQDPYRSHDSEEDGYKKNTPGQEGEMGGSGFGQNQRMTGPGNNEEAQNNYLPTDQDTFDRNMEPTESPAMTADDSPFNPMNHTEPMHVGPFNMHKSPRIDNMRMQVFDRIRETRKGR